MKSLLLIIKTNIKVVSKTEKGAWRISVLEENIIMSWAKWQPYFMTCSNNICQHIHIKKKYECDFFSIYICYFYYYLILEIHLEFWGPRKELRVTFKLNFCWVVDSSLYYTLIFNFYLLLSVKLELIILQ